MDCNEDILVLLKSGVKLDRDKGVLSMKTYISRHPNQLDHLERLVLGFLENVHNEETWESVHAHFQIGKLLLEAKAFTPQFPDRVLEQCFAYLDHAEFRVRILVGEVLGALCANVDSAFYKQCEPVLLANIRKHLTCREQTEGNRAAEEIFHDTAGWKSLETSMKALQAIIEGSGQSFFDFMNEQLLELIFESIRHTNRFVRETAYYLCASIARFGVSSREHCNQTMVKRLSTHLANGLADNWSQVRLAASVATRLFFQDLNDADKSVFFKELLPPMCLNRYYLAEGVKLYNQESWRLIMGTEGRKNVELHIKEVVEFYISQTECDNHAVREAACHCMAELGSKINKEAVKPHVPAILSALLICFKDESWPVRDTACVACGNFVLSFPDECQPVMEELYPLFFTNLGDPIPSVRQGAAVALTNVTKAYGEEAILLVFAKIDNYLKGIELQRAASERYEGLDKGNTTYGVVKKLRDNDIDLHSNQVMFSCGSLAPKMKRGGGCMDHCFKRDSEPWELADGCVFLLGELASNNHAHKHLTTSMPILVETLNYKHYEHHINYFESVNKVLPNLARGLGKRAFKAYIEQFFDMIFYSLTGENALTKVAASECLQFLSTFLGPNILRGRIENYNYTYISLYEQEISQRI